MRVEACMGQQLLRTHCSPWDRARRTDPTWGAEATFARPAGSLVLHVQDDRGVQLATVLVAEADWRACSPRRQTRAYSLEGGLGSLILTLHATTSSASDAMFFSRGLPASCLPLRLDAGDVVLFSSNHLLSFGTKMYAPSSASALTSVVIASR